MIRGSIESLQALENSLDTEALDRAVALLVDARSLWLVAAVLVLCAGRACICAFLRTTRRGSL